MTILTVTAGALSLRTSTCALFAIIIPLTLGLRTLNAPLSQLITAGSGIETLAEPPSTGQVTFTPLSNEMSVILEMLAQPSLSATPGQVDPAPVSAAALPQ